MVKKIVLVVLLLSLLLVIAFDVRFSVPVAASPSIICVPDDYQTIQEAINAADLGDIVLVRAGIYYEHVRVNKTVSLVGESRETTIIDGNRTGDILYVTADNVKITGFTIQNGGGFDGSLASGIVLNRSNGNTIYANTIASNVHNGIWLKESSGNMIIKNQILDNGYKGPLQVGIGIQLTYSNSNIISNNEISNNVVSGISLSSSNDNIINHNMFTNDSVSLSSSAENIVSDNVFTFSGVVIDGSSTRNTIERNQFKGGGIGIGRSSTNAIRGNIIMESTIAIGIAEMSTNNTVVGNTISNNLYGIKIHYSNGSIIYHNNFINNTSNAPEDVYPNVNTWDDGYPSGGNYWSDYNGTDFNNGPYQNLTGSDGIGDTPHTLYARNEDRFPLMGPISIFDVGAWNGTPCEVHVISNSTISNFQLSKTQKTVSFIVTGPDYTPGFCRVTIPNIIIQDLWQNNYTVLVDGEQPLDIRNWTDTENTYVYFTYQHSEHEVVIIPEFPAAIILPLFIIITLCTVILTKKIKP